MVKLIQRDLLIIGRGLNMAKKLYWKCPRCGAGYEAYDGEIPLKDGICEDCGGTLVKTPYTSNDWLFGNGELTGYEILNDIMENYIKTNPQYDAEVYEMWRKRRDGTQSTVFKSQQNANTPKCPTCGSTNIKKIGNLERGASVGLFGLFSSKIGKTMQCKNCGYKW